MPRDSLTKTLKIDPEVNPPPSELPTIWTRLIVSNQTGERVTGCLAQVLSIERLNRGADSAGQPLPGFEVGWLSWAPAQFKPVTIQSGQTRLLDLVWKLPNEPWLRVASSPRFGITRQQDTIVYEKTDRVKIRESGQYLIRLRIETAELPPIEKRYLFFWDGSHCDFQVTEVRPLEQSRSPVMPRLGTKSPAAHPDLADALTRRTLALFIGADLPHEVTGLPSRADLARELARRKGLDESLSLAEVAQRVSQASNRWEFTDFIRNALDTVGKSPQPFHKRIVELVKAHQIETLITTAYDNLLELAFQEAGIGINCVVRGSDVAFIRPDRPTLIKLYGDAQQPDALVVTDRDHSDLLRDQEKEPLVDEVRRAFRRNTVLFLSYNLADPDFRFLFDQIAESRFARTAYAVWPGQPEADVRMWRDRGIVILDVDPLGILGEVGILPVSPHRLEPTVTPPISQSFIGGKDMDFERGLDAFKRLAEGTDWHQDFAVHEASLRENLRDERRYGPSEQARRDRTPIVDQLNALALEHLSISFNDLCMGQQLPSKPQPAGSLGSRSLRLTDVLSIYPEHDGCPHKAGPAQWFSRLRVESKIPIHGCRGKIYEIRRLNDPNDQQGASLPEFHASYLSWGSRGRSGVFEPISIQPKDTEYLDLVWRAHGDPPIPENQLRVASSLDRGERNTSSSDWGKRQDFIPLEPGYYLLVVRVWADGYNIPVECTYRLYWPGPGQENDVRLVEIVGAHGVKGDGASADPEPLYGIGSRWAVLVGVNKYDDQTNYGQLQVCVKDVHAIREQLVAGGFDPARIRLLTDDTTELPTRDNILVALKAAADATDPDDLLLFYYSGHGDQDGGESYLVARNGRRLVLSDTAVRVSRVKEIVEDAPARAKVIVLDACHSGADIGGKGPKPMSEAFIRRVFEQAEGMAVLASCKQGQLSYEWRENERSVFTHFLLEALEGRADRDEKGFVTVQDANQHVTNGVKLWASQRNLSQIPTLQYTVAGDIILVRHQ